MPLRLLVVLPSWVGDAVMATPALRLLRDGLPGCFIGALARPGIDQVLAGTTFIDHWHVDRARGVMGPKLVAAGLRPLRYDTALLLTNSFSTALITRLAWIPRRIGYDRDARGLLLTDRLKPLRRDNSGGFAPVPAVEYYLTAARAVFHGGPASDGTPSVSERGGPSPIRLELATTSQEQSAADDILKRAGIAPTQNYAVLNPGANNPDKRWPADRFGALAAHLMQHHGLSVLVNGSPSEADLAEEVIRQITPPPPHLPTCSSVSLPSLGITLSSLKPILRRAAILITNDTGPRHIAAAFGTPTITLFGPTDPRWTTLPPAPPPPPRSPPSPPSPPLLNLVADPTLPPDQVADDHPDRCRIDRIELAQVIAAADRLLGPAASPQAPGARAITPAPQ